MSATETLQRRFAEPEILVVPGAADALTARVIEDVGFDAVYVTGAGFSNAGLGRPDVGLATLTEITTHVRRIVDAVDIPVIVDADTGYGGVLNVYRTITELEHAGAAAVQLEDQAIPKRCGHFDGTIVVDEVEMLERIDAALAARVDPALALMRAPTPTRSRASTGRSGVRTPTRRPVPTWCSWRLRARWSIFGSCPSWSAPRSW